MWVHVVRPQRGCESMWVIPVCKATPKAGACATCDTIGSGWERKLPASAAYKMHQLRIEFWQQRSKLRIAALWFLPSSGEGERRAVKMARRTGRNEETKQNRWSVPCNVDGYFFLKSTLTRVQLEFLGVYSRQHSCLCVVAGPLCAHLWWRCPVSESEREREGCQCQSWFQQTGMLTETHVTVLSNQSLNSP